ncbi:hypothetical protein [Leek white stripe virus]|nr:hypothetical protein [Leek white stripe virus]CAA64247.1 ORF 1 [Leek white stripe virus]
MHTPQCIARFGTTCHTHIRTARLLYVKTTYFQRFLFMFFVYSAVPVLFVPILFIAFFHRFFKLQLGFSPEATALMHRFVDLFSRDDEPVITETSCNVDFLPGPESRKENLVAPKRRNHYIVKVAMAAKSQVGLLGNSRANELVYARLCREEMVKHGVRPSHIARMVPLAVDCHCFIPMDEDIMAAEMMRTDVMRSRRKDMGDSHAK